jgi:hypothetical protein
MTLIRLVNNIDEENCLIHFCECFLDGLLIINFVQFAPAEALIHRPIIRGRGGGGRGAADAEWIWININTYELEMETL